MEKVITGSEKEVKAKYNDLATDYRLSSVKVVQPPKETSTEGIWDMILDITARYNVNLDEI